MSWKDRALCVDQPDMFCPSDDVKLTPEDIAHARAVCRRCPVIAECRAAGATLPMKTGVWYGQYFKEPRPAPPPLTSQMSEARMRMWEDGLNDAEIARACNVAPDSIRAWRRQRNLPSRFVRTARPVSDQPVPPERVRENLYRQGLTDRQIAEKEGVAIKAVTIWRTRRKWAPNPDLHETAQRAARHAARRAVYDEGATDKEIARRCGITAKQAQDWRRREKLPARPDDFAFRRQMWAEGATDSEIAREEGVSERGIVLWRTRHNLAENRAENTA